jgi:CheY-like chemotaxis protein
MKLEDPKVERLCERLDRQSMIMTRMLDDLLDAARLASGKTSVQMEDIVLSDLLCEIVGENEGRDRAAGIDLEFEISSTRPCHVKGDRVRLRQIVDNLLSNAIKFTPAPGRVTVRLRAEGSSAILRIEDTGVGFDSSFTGRLFEPFTQQEQPSHRLNGGLGLGLAISKKLAELQGCSLSGESRGPGRGATFTLTLPLAAASPATTMPSDELPRRTDRRRVLLIEDNKDVSDVLAELISLCGFEVDVAYDGRSALTRAIAEPPDLILCDVGLPGGMDGYAVARALRTESRLRFTRLFAVSGYSQPKDHADAKQAGFDRLVSKPLTVETLKALLNEPMLQL